MTPDTQTHPAGNGLAKMVLSIILLAVSLAAVGCKPIGTPEPKLTGSWNTGTTGSLILNRDGTYTMTVKGTFPLDSVITNESGKWGVKDDRLNLKNDKSSAITKYRYQLSEKGDQLRLTLDSPLNPSGVTITYQMNANP